MFTRCAATTPPLSLRLIAGFPGALLCAMRKALCVVSAICGFSAGLLSVERLCVKTPKNASWRTYHFSGFGSASHSINGLHREHAESKVWSIQTTPLSAIRYGNFHYRKYFSCCQPLMHIWCRIFHAKGGQMHEVTQVVEQPPLQMVDYKAFRSGREQTPFDHSYELARGRN